MTTVETGSEGRSWHLFFPRKTKIPNLMFHIHQDSPFRIDARLLKGRTEEINEVLRQVDVHFSTSDLIRGNLHRWFGRNDPIEEIVFRRVNRFIDGYLQAVVLREGGYEPIVVASGDSGIHLAAVVAGVLSFPDALDLFVRESRGLAIVQNDLNRNESPYPEFPLHTEQAKVSLGDFYDFLAEIDINDPKIPVVGGMGNTMMTGVEIIQELSRQAVELSSEEAVRATLGSMGIRNPHEIGQDKAGANKYLTVAASAAKRRDVQVIVGGVLFGTGIFLGVREVQKRRQKSKKA